MPKHQQSASESALEIRIRVGSLREAQTSVGSGFVGCKGQFVQNRLEPRVGAPSAGGEAEKPTTSGSVIVAGRPDATRSRESRSNGHTTVGRDLTMRRAFPIGSTCRCTKVFTRTRLGRSSFEGARPPAPFSIPKTLETDPSLGVRSSARLESSRSRICGGSLPSEFLQDEIEEVPMLRPGERPPLFLGFPE